MNTLQDLINNSTLTRLFANIFLFVLVIGSAGVVGYEIITRQDINLVAASIVTTALGSSIKILGISAGITFAQQNTIEAHTEAKDVIEVK